VANHSQVSGIVGRLNPVMHIKLPRKRSLDSRKNPNDEQKIRIRKICPNHSQGLSPRQGSLLICGTGSIYGDRCPCSFMAEAHRIDVELLSAFNGLDGEAGQLLKEFSARFGLDISTWKSNRIQYFKDAYPVFAFLAVWMDESDLNDLVDRFGDILRAGVYAVAGYGILDENVDSNTPSPVEMLVAQSLIAEYEKLALDIFGVTSVNLEIMHRMRSLFLEAEVRENPFVGKAVPTVWMTRNSWGQKVPIP